MEISPILNVEHLEVTYTYGRKQKAIIQDVSFRLYPGEMVAMTGKSGAGKSIVSHAVVGLLDKGVSVTNGQIMFEGKDIVQFNEKQFEHLRRNHIAIMIQHSLNGLDPIRLVKKQMLETIRQRKPGSKKEVELLLHNLLTQVGFKEPEQILDSFPFELSGGMRQRVLLAMMLSLQPKILIADEPTTALDVINREKVLSLLKQLQRNLDLTILLISHDENSVRKYADRVVYINEGGVLL
ncbi:oligopeptide ABC superfamily ATP binding cassette transporter, ABC protein [Sporosarcina newyorkensis 2681]|uniref:Oligopeptide ABC superfamily ATP binding cassette transporter, ABC protein n=1 Tax=Sporosarcina newyorkensis 2681 TaxID=1027292 RepID=F9DQX6_9BACL|nr:ABC transporter ATP-binding protein [Sporosarcina newyorkensis]EGQ26815.1 oligopeptide ABC superfamily ATP binding cassette transporter, ABC protein [Sporosarcina newyorkensis 2681]MBY0221632.1 ABC transporter ATP-binding protein [Sporosarcina aquimarina]